MGKTPSFRPAPAIEPLARGILPRDRSDVVGLLAERLARLCRSAGLDKTASHEADRVFRELIVPWSRVEEFARAPNAAWVSEISDDNTPIEFSVTLSPAGNEVRVLFEPQGEAQTLEAHRKAALDMHQQLEQQYGADLSRFRVVKDLFTPPAMRGPFALWSAVVFANGKPPSFKAYFNPQAQGIGGSVALVDEGLRRLGLTHAWRHLAATLARRGPHRDELKYFALDLSSSLQARVKVYVRHHEATPEDLEFAASAASSTHGEAEDFARAMGGETRRFRDRATFTCAAFVGGSDDRPSATTHYVPVCAYAIDDFEVQLRVSNYLRAQGMDDAPYRAVLSAFANRALNKGVGMQSWIAFRRYQGVPRLTVYLSTETRCVFPAGSVPAGTSEHMHFETAEQVLRCVARYGLEEHPLIHGLCRWAGRRDVLWLLVSNASELLGNTMDISAARLNAWLSDNAELERTLGPECEEFRHLFVDAIEDFRASPDAVEAAAAIAVACNAARSLAKTLAEFIEAEETSSVGFSVESILREGLAADSVHMSALNAAGVRAVPAVKRGAFGMHQRLWSALDRLEVLSFAETGG